MASRLLELGIVNAVCALALALVVWLISRTVRNSHLSALLWFVVLLILITPPIFFYPIQVAGKTEQTRQQNDEKTPSLPNQKVQLEGAHDAPPETSPLQNDRASIEQAGNGQQPLDSKHQRFPQTAKPAAPKESPANVLWQFCVPKNILLIWLGGSLVAAFLLVFNGIRFNRIVKSPLSVSVSGLDARLQRSIEKAGLARKPELKVLPLDLHPLIWSWLGKTKIVLSQSLLAELTDEQQEMVLLHEIAHLKRRDHLVRWLEALSQVVYWWLLPVRWIRNELHAAQETCCDAFVHQNFPNRRAEYGETLLKVASHFGPNNRVPIIATEFGNRSQLKTRLKLILKGDFSSPPHKPITILCLVAGIVLSICSVQWVVADTNQEAEKTDLTHVAEVVVTHEDGRPAQAGTVRVSGHPGDGKFFDKTFSINNGKARIELKGDRLDEITFRIKVPACQKYLQKFIRQKNKPYLPLETTYRFSTVEGQKIGGRVVDTNGEPIVGVLVYAHSPSNIPIVQGFHCFEEKTTTNAAGRWMMDNAPRDIKSVAIRISHDAYLSPEGPGIAIIDSAEDIGKLTDQTDVRAMLAATTLSGKVVGSDGKPVADAMMLLSNRDLYSDYGAKLIPVTDSEGRFRFEKIEPGHYSLTVFSPEWCLKTIAVSIPASEPLYIKVNKGQRVEFRVKDKNNTPLPGVRFNIAGVGPNSSLGSGSEYSYTFDFLNNRNLLKNRTDENGVYVWNNAPDEPLRYNISSPTVLATYDNVYSPDVSPHEIILRRKIQVNATVVDDLSGDLIDNYELFTGAHFHQNPSINWDWHHERMAEFQPGKFSTSLHATDRTYRYRIQASGYRPAISDSYDALQLPDDPIAFTFRLQKDDGYTGTVVSQSGDRAKKAEVYIRVGRRHGKGGLKIVNGIVDPESATERLQTDDQGKFSIPAYDDPFLCLIEHEDGYAELTDVEMYASTEIKLTSWSKLEGTLSIDERPVAGVAIHLAQGPRFQQSELPFVFRSHQLKTDTEGKFTVNRIESGSWRQTVSYPSGNRYRMSANAEVPVNKALNQQLGGPAAIDLVGQIVVADPEEIDWQRSSVVLLQQQSPVNSESGLAGEIFHSQKPNVDGTFRFHNLNPQEHVLRVSLVYSGERRVRNEWQTTVSSDLFTGKSVLDPVDLGKITPTNK